MRNDPRVPRRLSSVVAVASLIGLAGLGTMLWFVARPAGSGPVDCSDSAHRNTIEGTVSGDVEVTAHGTVCTIRGTVVGDVIVHDQGAECARQVEPVTAVEVVDGTVEGDIRAVGDRCVMVWLRDGASVRGDVIYRAGGSLGFLGDAAGASVRGDVFLGGGDLWATGASTGNRVEGDLVCQGGRPKEGLGSGTASNWDGFEDDIDGTVGGTYLSC